MLRAGKVNSRARPVTTRDSTNPHPGHHVTPPEEQAKGLYPATTMQVSWEKILPGSKRRAYRL